MKDTVRDKDEGGAALQALQVQEEESEHALLVAEAQGRMQNTPAAKHQKKESAGAKESAAQKSRERTFQIMRGFYQTTATRNNAKGPGWKIKRFDDPAVLKLDCQEYIDYCMANGIIPTKNLFAVWEDCDASTLDAEANLSSASSGELKKLWNQMFTFLQQFQMQYEGNPVTPIFPMKYDWGVSDQQPIDVNVHTDAPRQINGADLKTMIDLTPDEVHEK